MSSKLFIDLLNGFKEIALDIGVSEDVIDLIDSYVLEESDDTLEEAGIFDKPTVSNWVSASGNKINLNVATAQSQPPTQSSTAVPTNGKYVVRIVSHGGRLRALATDGVHPAAWVAFPNDLRQFEGQQYEVDQLIWNGKNYRVAGNIVEI